MLTQSLVLQLQKKKKLRQIWSKFGKRGTVNIKINVFEKGLLMKTNFIMFITCVSTKTQQKWEYLHKKINLY